MPDLQSTKFAIANGDIDALKLSLETAKVSTDALLMTAADYGQVEAIELLLSSGADVNYKDGHNITPLLCAVFEDHVEAAKCLLKHGAQFRKLTTPDGDSYESAASSEAMKSVLSSA